MSDLEIDYRNMLPILKALESEVTRQLETILNQSEVTLAIPIEHRVKSLDSLRDKIQGNGLSPDAPVASLTDLVGFRIVLVFKRDLTRVQQLIESSFALVSSEDTAARLTETQFGYQSHHYTCRIPRAWTKLPSFKGLAEIHFEIQVRTAAQHIWAAASHKLQYKRESSIPSPLRRTIHRAAAMLETVDLEFERALLERDQYESGSTETIADEINVVSLRTLLEAEWPEENSRGEEETYGELAQNLSNWDITSLARLKDFIRKHKKAALEEDRPRQTRFTLVGLTRVALGHEFGDQWHNLMPGRKKGKQG
jgi:putative GTP pyrophosphokinase